MYKALASYCYHQIVDNANLYHCQFEEPLTHYLWFIFSIISHPITSDCFASWSDNNTRSDFLQIPIYKSLIGYGLYTIHVCT